MGAMIVKNDGRLSTGGIFDQRDELSNKLLKVKVVSTLGSRKERFPWKCI